MVLTTVQKALRPERSRFRLGVAMFISLLLIACSRLCLSKT